MHTPYSVYYYTNGTIIKLQHQLVQTHKQAHYRREMVLADEIILNLNLFDF